MQAQGSIRFEGPNVLGCRIRKVANGDSGRRNSSEGQCYGFEVLSEEMINGTSRRRENG